MSKEKATEEHLLTLLRDLRESISLRRWGDIVEHLRNATVQVLSLQEDLGQIRPDDELGFFKTVREMRNERPELRRAKDPQLLDLRGALEQSPRSIQLLLPNGAIIKDAFVHSMQLEERPELRYLEYLDAHRREVVPARGHRHIELGVTFVGSVYLERELDNG